MTTDDIARERGSTAKAEPTKPATRKRGRPVKKHMPEPIPDTPENIARSIMQGPPKKDWDYLKDKS